MSKVTVRLYEVGNDFIKAFSITVRAVCSLEYISIWVTLSDFVIISDLVLIQYQTLQTCCWLYSSFPPSPYFGDLLRVTMT